MKIRLIMRITTIIISLFISSTICAQGWVMDEASKDDSGGIFSGIMGLFLLIGVIWFIGYIMDKISEDRDIRERRKLKKQNNTQPLHQAVQKKGETIPNVSIDQLILDEDKAKFSLINIPKPPVVKMLLEQKEYIKKMKIDYVLSETKKDDFKNAVIEWGEPFKYDIERPANAFYSSDGKKLLRCTPPRYRIKEGVEIIADNSLKENNKKTIELPSTVKVIGNCVFFHSNITSFVIPQSVETITGNPFVKCSVLLGNSSPNFLLSNHVLYDKEKLRIISVLSYDIDIDYCFESSVIVIGRFSFYGVSDDRFPIIELPPHIKYIGESAFEESKFRQIGLCDEITEIDKSAFKRSSITNMILPKSLQKLGESAFEDCIDLEDITIFGNLQSIEIKSFCGCTNLNHVYIPEGVKYLKSKCFYDCKSLTEVRFPNSVMIIKEHAFIGCPLDNVVLSRNTVVEKGAFPSGCQILFRD